GGINPAFKPLVDYWKNISVTRTHNGYFSIDRKTSKLKDPTVKSRGEEAGFSDDVDAYDLIMKDKERLLSTEEPVRFIFSHSALREGWDNPNVFVMCMLKHSDSTISRRQEVGRGLRISVNRDGERMDNPGTVHDVNVLTVVSSESYTDFVSNLQREISESLSARPRLANEAYFVGKTISSETGKFLVTPAMAKQIYRYLLKNDITDDDDKITENNHNAKAEGNLAKLPEELVPHSEQLFALIDSVFSESQLPDVKDDRKPKTNPLNSNFEKKEFQELWRRINKKAIYRVDFDSNELVGNCIRILDKELRVMPLTYLIQKGEQTDQATYEELQKGNMFTVKEVAVEYGKTAHSAVSYDLLGKLAENTHLTRKTIVEILSKLQSTTFELFKQNPEQFIAEASRLINEQKATVIIERLTYDTIAETHDIDIFTAAQTRQDFAKAGEKLQNHIYDYVIADSGVERDFAKELDTSSEVVVYAKLPGGFRIPTPVGDYNPDWAISFKDGKIRHIYFVAETKGSMSSLELRSLEQTKIECARKFFAEINRRIDADHVKYDVVTNYSKLMEIVGA
ncbi:MAG: restriction endonuclease subunit R, partial [Lentisphaerae bacterium]|nr:restriction endonuclease subunit R [Lentisphaerota bacterium]